ncbi:MAG: hypothetical protein IJJ68_03325 [Prevotella sp.]|nr:hypothetical protein [Prevotella sp.]
MTQQDKDLLLRDLCARLPYGVKVNISAVSPNRYDEYVPSINDATINAINLNTEKCNFKEFYWDNYIVNVRPYLRPMSSMTEKECYELHYIRSSFTDNWKYIKTPIPLSIANYNQVDWLNSHHLDYRGLIEKGLAIAVTDENNPYK